MTRAGLKDDFGQEMGEIVQSHRGENVSFRDFAYNHLLFPDDHFAETSASILVEDDHEICTS